MERRTSASLYGSAATGNWIAARSDLDVLILVSESQVESLGKIIERWKVTPGHPILDGFALFFSRNILMAKRLEEFHRQAHSAVSEIQLIDFWNMKYRSKHLFGTDFVKEFPQIELADLSDWARRELGRYFGHTYSGEMPRIKLVLSKLIWSVSWVARLLMLSRGMVCDSKKDALTWLAQEYIEIREPVSLLLSDFYKSDTEPTAITSNQSETLRGFLFKLAVKESGSSD